MSCSLHFSLTLYLTIFFSKVAIKARVTGKTPIKTWSNSKGEGKLFSMDLLDDSGEIRLTAFKDQADLLFDLIKVFCLKFIAI